ncbi:MAG: protein kinase [Deltaproteobacteria bacterium]|nr:protein kinase [Deltaproteobacteria bacterium]
MECAREAELQAFVAGELASTSRQALEAKLDECAHCRRRLGELARAADSLTAAPGEAATLTQDLLSGEPDPRLGSIIGGRYRVERLLGSGGMGAVYEVVHTVIQRRFALKILHPHLATRTAALQRFRNEARVAGAIGHPGIVRAFDVGRGDAGEPFLVLELLDGHDLETELARHAPLPVVRTLQMGIDMADALATAHAAGVIHRDLKPANIFLTREGELKVVDFGISKVRGELQSGPTTEDGMLLGTPMYMAPEQLQDATNADARSDIYSVAAILYRALTGQVTRPATSLANLVMHALTSTPPSPRAIRADVPEALDALIVRCLQVAPERRPRTMDELRDALRSMAASTRRTSVRPMGRSERRTVLVVAVRGLTDGDWAAAHLEQAGAAALPGEGELFLAAMGEGSWTSDLVARAGKLALELAERAEAVWVGSGALADGSLELADDLAAATRDASEGVFITRSLAHARMEGLSVVEAQGRLHLVEGAAAPTRLALQGRRVEIVSLEEVLEASLAERRAEIALVGGPLGIGKSRLLEALGASARPAWQVRSSTCDPHGGDFTLVQRLVDLAEVTTDEAGDTRLSVDRRRIEALDALEVMVAAGPTLFLIDDGRFADGASLSVLEELCRRSRSPLVLVFAYREVPDATRWPASQGTVLRPRPLRRHETERLLAELVGDRRAAELADRVQGQTRGNPLFVEQTGLALRDHHTTEVDLPLPPDIEGLLQARLEELAPTLREVLKRASILGAPFTAPDLRSLGIEELDTQDLDELTDKGLLERIGGAHPSFRVVSPLLAKVASRMLDPLASEELHRQSALLLDGRVEPERVADHLERGGRPAEAAFHYAQAVARAHAAGDVSRVLASAGRALALGADGELAIRKAYAEALGMRGRFADQIEVLEAAEKLTSGAERAALATERAVTLQRLGRSGEALPLLDQVVQEAEAADDPLVLARAIGKRAVALTYAGEAARAAEELRRVERLVLTRAPELRAEAAVWRGQLAAVSGDIGDSRNAYWAAVELYRELGDLRRSAEASVNLADFYNRVGAYDEAIPALRAALDDCRRVGASRVMEGYAWVNLGYAHLGEGDLQEAEAALDEAARIAADVDSTRLALAERVYRSRVALAGRRIDQARAIAETAVKEAERRGVKSVEALARVAAAEVALAAGDGAVASSQAQRALALHDELGGIEEGAGQLFHVLSQALTAIGDATGAAAARARGRALVETGASRIGDRHWQARFLEDVPAHAALREAS